MAWLIDFETKEKVFKVFRVLSFFMQVFMNWELVQFYKPMDGLGAVLDIFDPLVNNDGKVTIVDLKFKDHIMR